MIWTDRYDDVIIPTLSALSTTNYKDLFKTFIEGDFSDFTRHDFELHFYKSVDYSIQQRSGGVGGMELTDFKYEHNVIEYIITVVVRDARNNDRFELKYHAKCDNECAHVSAMATEGDVNPSSISIKDVVL